jgi:hypothetical protein
MAATPDKGSLHNRTLDLLKQSEVPLPEIYKETHLPYYWLKKFSSGEIRDPSVNRVQRLYEYLAGKQLEV